MAAERADSFDDALRGYHEGMTWARFDVAATHVPPKERAQFVDDWDERSKDVKITEYDIVKVTQRGTHEAKVEIKLEWYRESQGTVHETRVLETWELQGKLWLVVEEARVRGEPMPGLPEPAAKEQTSEGLGRRGSGLGLGSGT
ncbi:MAG TPA: hypothetical protein VGF94_23850 [Kofleriaceae bacterium]